MIEMLNGYNHYALITQKLKPYYGLSIALMLLLILFGDYSVHSSNVVCIQYLSVEKKLMTQFARIDLGAAFEYFAYYEDILNPFEYQGIMFNFKSYTKGYIFNYKKIKGLFPAIAAKATKLLEKIDRDLISSIASSALHAMPGDLLTASVQEELAQYLGISSFKKITLSDPESYREFAIDFSELLLKRLNKIAKLQDLTENDSFLYQSMILDKQMLVEDQIDVDVPVDKESED